MSRRLLHQGSRRVRCERTLCSHEEDDIDGRMYWWDLRFIISMPRSQSEYVLYTHFETEYGFKSRREMRRYVAWYIRELKRVIRDGNLPDLLSNEIEENEFILFYRTEGVEVCLSPVLSV